VVFESHILDVQDNGVIIKYRLNGTSLYIPLSDLDDDCRQPNWSPSGEHILYQKYEHSQWEIYIMDIDGNNPYMLTDMPGSKTDASFSPDGQWVVFSLENEDGEELIRITDSNTYDGAPSWSPDGTKIVFESSPGDPEDTGTTIWMIEVSGLY
jgi:TolB protein